VVTTRPAQESVIEPERLLKELYASRQENMSYEDYKTVQERVKNSLLMIAGANEERQIKIIRSIDNMLNDSQFQFNITLHHLQPTILENLRQFDVLIKHIELFRYSCHLFASINTLPTSFS